MGGAHWGGHKGPENFYHRPGAGDLSSQSVNFEHDFLQANVLQIQILFLI